MDRATAAAAEVARINTFFPLLPQLGLRWAAKRPWEGMTVAVNAHLTTLTAALVRELALGGGTWVVCAANEATTDPGVVELLRQQGIQVETGRDGNDRYRATLDAHPELLADVGYELISTLLEQRPNQAKGSGWLTRRSVWIFQIGPAHIHFRTSGSSRPSRCGLQRDHSEYCLRYASDPTCNIRC